MFGLPNEAVGAIIAAVVAGIVALLGQQLRHRCFFRRTTAPPICRSLTKNARHPIWIAGIR